MKRMYRAQILLEPEQHEELSRIARQESRSISEIARRAIRAGLASLSMDPSLRSRRAEALRGLRSIRRAIQRKTGIIQRDLVQESRDERFADLFPGEH